MAHNNTTKSGSLNQMKKLQAGNARSNDSNGPYIRPRRPNYHQLHSKPLPLEIYPLPAFIPHNPLSYLRVAFAVIAFYVSPSSSHAHVLHGYFNASTRSVHVTDAKSIRALWEMGFFGKGNLSRSEPTWLDQEKKRLGLLASSTSEEITEQRRKEREWMKRERARVEQELLAEQIKKETVGPTQQATKVVSDRKSAYIEDSNEPAATASLSLSSQAFTQSAPTVLSQQLNGQIVDQEHLQLSLEESFFLIYALGAFKLTDFTLSNAAVLSLFRQHSHFPSLEAAALSPDDPFLVNYAVYHHFRSLGWVVREGLKFAVDYLLYESGPVFKHAAFAVMVVPAYRHEYWQGDKDNKTSVQRRKGMKNWTWLHCVNRVQTQVLKTLILCYVDVPAPDEIIDKDIGTILSLYKVREFSISRWSANRNRD